MHIVQKMKIKKLPLPIDIETKQTLKSYIGKSCFSKLKRCGKDYTKSKYHHKLFGVARGER